MQSATIGARQFGRRAARGGLLALLCALLLGGCAKLEFGSEFREDGSATHTIQVDFERGALNDADFARVQSRLDQAERQAQDDGYQTTRIDTPTDIGLRISNTTKPAPAANGGGGAAVDPSAALNSLFNSLSADTNLGPVAPFTGTYARQSGAVGGSAWALNLTVNADLLFQGLVDGLSSSGVALSTDQLRQQLALNYVATLPGEIKDTNGERTAANAVRWQLPPSGTATLRAESKVGKSGSTAWFIIAAIGGFVGVVLVATAVGVVLLRRRHAGRARLPIALPGADSNPNPQYVATDQPATMAEVGSSLARVVERVVSGSPVEQPAKAEDDDAPDERRA